MWKKIGVALIALIGTCSVVYAMNHELSAEGYQSGGNVTGTIAFERGDRFYSNTLNPTNGKPMDWIVAKSSSYTSYANESCTPTLESNCVNPQINAFLTLADQSIGNNGESLTPGHFKAGIRSEIVANYANYVDTSLYIKMDNFNSKNLDTHIMAPRDDTAAQEIITKANNLEVIDDNALWNILNPVNKIAASEYNGAQEHGKKFFTYEIGTSSLLPPADLTFSEAYFTSTLYDDSVSIRQSIAIVDSSGSINFDSYTAARGAEYAIRPLAYFDSDKFVFGISKGTSSGIASIKKDVIGETNLYTDSRVNDIMKLRYENAGVTGSPILNKIEKKDGTEITIAATDSIVYINADAKEGTSAEGVNTVSALIFDKDGKFKYYRPLGTAKGVGKYKFDLTGIPEGEYVISIVNEAYNDALLTPASSSKIVGAVSLKIKDMLDIEYNADFDTYTYDDNVHVTDVIGKVSFKKGEAPITFKIQATKGHPTDYQNFDISPTSESDETKKINVSIKSGGPNVNTNTTSLEAGTYYFTIVGLDKNGAPLDDDGNPLAIADVVVAVEQAQPTIKFDTEDKGTREINGSLTEAVNFEEHATHTNKDILNKSPGGNDYDVIYTKVSGTEGLITTLPQTATSGGKISLSATANTSGSIVLKAQIEETKNYIATETTKTINVNVGLDANYVEDKTNIKAGSAEAKPSDTAIGHIEAAGGKTPYSYEFTGTSNNNGSFRIDSDGKIYINTSVGETGLVPGSYTIEVKVTDSTSTTAQTKTVKKIITITSADLTGVAFENPDKAKDPVTEIKRTYDPSTTPAGGTFHTKLFETDTDSLKGTTITYSVEENEILEYTGMNGLYANFKVKKASANPIQINAHVTGGAYGADGVDMKIPVTIEKYKQEIQFAQGESYDIANTASCTSIPATQKSTYWNQDDASNKIAYTSSDESKATIGAGGKICPVKDATGTITLTANLTGDDNYTDAEATIIINLISALKGGYIEDKTNIIAGSAEAKPSTTTKIGHFTATGGTSGYTYEKKTGTNNNDKFDIKENGDVYVSAGAGTKGLLPGTYTIEVEVTDSTSPTAQKATITKEITIKPATLSVKFEDPDDSSKTIENVITRTFDLSTDPAGGSFHTRLVNTDGSPFTGADVTYSVEADPNEVLEYVDKTSDYGNFKVKKASSDSEKNQIKIKAHVFNGYYGSEGKDVTILVNVEKYEQAIEFKQTNPYQLANTSECVAISATQKSDYWNVTEKNKIKYESKDTSKLTIDSEGKIYPVKGATGTVILNAKLAGDANYTDATATITISLLGELKLTYEETTPLKQAVNPDKTDDTGNAKDEAVFGPVKVTGGVDRRYDIQIKNDDYAYPYFELSQVSGNDRASTLKLKTNVSITASILKEGITKGVIKQDETDKDQYNWTIQVLPDTGEEPQSIVVHILGADPVLTFEKEVEGNLTTTYKKDGTIDLSVKRGDSVMDSGISVEGTAGYSTYIKDVSSYTTDAQLNGTGIVKSNCDDDDTVIGGRDFKLTPKAEASDGYKSGTGTAIPVIIKKADHPDVDFEDSKTILSSYIQSVDKGFTGILPNDKHLEIIPQGESTWSGSSFIKDSEGDTTKPSVTITPNGFEGRITYEVNGGGTDNYKSIKDKEIYLAFAANGGISYRPIKITYGDNTQKVIDYISDADKDKNTYTYAPVEGTTYVNDMDEELFTLDGTTSTITTKQVGKTKVNVTRTDENGNIITQAISVEIVPKEITLTYESNTIYAGEELPTPAFKEPESGVLVGSDTIDMFPIPAEAAHYKGTEAIKDSKTTGTYDTKGNWTSDEVEFDVNPNYKVTIKAGKLTIKKDTVKDTWYHLENPDGNTVSKDKWHNYYVDVVLDTATGNAGTYDQISSTETFTDIDKTRFTVTNEDENTQDVYFRIDPETEVDHKGAITSTQAPVKIDMTKPNVTKITGYPVNTDGLSELINNLTFGMFYKPGVEITVETEDPQPTGETGRTVSGVDTVSYKVYTLDEKGGFDATQTPEVKVGKVDANGKISFKINNVGNYRICAIAKDNATNPSNENCSDVNVKKIDVDIDGDGTNDFVDTDDNGCPDLNIILGNDSKGNPVKLNVAEKDKNYPYMNIDSDGDAEGGQMPGKADLNIDTDHDGKPDLNLVIMDASLWKPTICVVESKLKDYTEPVEYCTGTKVKAQINVDTDGDGVPNINIDTDGDMEPDINIDTDHDGKANTNINTIETWIPEKDYLSGGFTYDTMSEVHPYLNIDTNNDGYPDINIDLDGDGVADINIDTDNNGIPDVDIDSTGDGKPDTNIDTNGDGKPNEKIVDLTEWKPDKIIQGDVPYGTMDLTGDKELADGGIIIENPDGSFLPNNAIKVNENTGEISDSVKKELESLIGDQEIGKGYEIIYYNGSTQGQPSGNVKVKIPVDENIKNPRIVIRQKDGSFQEVKYKMEDGYWVYETDYVDQVYVTSDAEKGAIVVPDPDKNTDTSDGDTNTQNANSSVKGAYTNQANSNMGMGGASTGDQTNGMLYGSISIFSLICISMAIKKRRKG